MSKKICYGVSKSFVDHMNSISDSNAPTVCSSKSSSINFLICVLVLAPLWIPIVIGWYNIFYFTTSCVEKTEGRAGLSFKDWYGGFISLILGLIDDIRSPWRKK